MKKYFVYELKKNLRFLIILVIACAVPYALYLSTTSLFQQWGRYNEAGELIGEELYNYDGGLTYAAVMIGVLATVLPMVIYSFKMNKRSVDVFYALPISREKLYFVKTLVGLILTLVPFTIAYVLGVSVVCFRDNYYDLLYYLPTYFGLVFFGTCIYGFVSFFFMRANNVGDGAVFVMFAAFVVEYVLYFLSAIFNGYSPIFGNQGGEFILYGGMTYFTSFMVKGLGGKLVGHTLSALSFVVPLVYGLIGYGGLFLSLRKERSENAEQISSSWFGYKIMLPVYIVTSVGLQTEDLLSFALLGLLSFAGYALYKRKMKLPWQDWLAFGISVVIGLIFAMLI